MFQIGRNLNDEFDGVPRNKAVLLLDRDAKYTRAFRAAIERGRTRVIRLPPRSPNLNAYAERFVRSIHGERNHQGLGNAIPFQSSQVDAKSGKVVRMERLGGLLNYYERPAA